jgi:paraquat-inducible protein B
VFTLYPDHDRIHDHLDLAEVRCVVIFKDSVRGLSRGAPVEYHGIKVGQVEDLTLDIQPGHPEGTIPVLLSLEPERFNPVGGPAMPVDQILDGLVKRGLRAQLKMGSLLTGSLFIDLSFQAGSPRRFMARHGEFAEIPTLPSSMGALAEKLTRFVDRLEKLPLEDLVAQVRADLPVLKATLEQTQALVRHLDATAMPQAEATLHQAQATLASLDQVLRSDSPARSDLHEALEEFTRAARAMKDLADTLERHPEALLFGKGNKP